MEKRLLLNDFDSLPWAIGGALYIIGALMYMMKIPERFKPGTFDIVVIFILTYILGFIPLIVPLFNSNSCSSSLQSKYICIS